MKQENMHCKKCNTTMKYSEQREILKAGWSIKGIDVHSNTYIGYCDACENTPIKQRMEPEDLTELESLV